MIMRFHVGLGVGHTYAHGLAAHGVDPHSDAEGPHRVDDEEVELQVDEDTFDASRIEDPGDGVDDDEVLEREDEEDTFGAKGTGDPDGLSNEEDSDTNEVDDEELLAMDEMYGS